MTDYPSLPVLTAAQMRACDTFTMRTVPSRVLMERAAAAVVRCVDELSPSDTPALVLCGGGNNGGDGFAAARFLSAGTYGPVRSVSVLYLGRLTTDGTPDADRMSAECARQYALCRDVDVSVLTLPDDAAVDELIAALAMGSIVIDAVFGIGLDRPVDGLIARVFRSVKAAGVPVTAVDIPSGVNADTGCVMGEALSCAATVTMQALKPGLLLYPGADFCGRIAAADIGIDWVSSVAPVYFGQNFDAAYDHYKTISEATDLPFMVYAIIGKLVPDQAAKFFDLKNVYGMKYTGRDYYELGALRRKLQKPAIFFAGADEQELNALATGEYAGVIGTTDNQMPRIHSTICRLAAEGRFIEAREYQDKVCRFVDVLFAPRTNSSLHKSVMKYLGIDCGNGRRPAGRPLTQAEYDAYIAEVEALGIFRKNDANLI